MGANSIAAQRTLSSLDVGAVRVRYADTLSVSAATVTPDVSVDWERAIAQVTGTFSQFGGGGWSTQAATSGSVFTGTRRSLLGELAGTAGGSAHEDGTRTGQAIVNARLHAMNVRSGVFAGAGAGSTWDGSAWRRLLLGELGGWINNGVGMAFLTITPIAVNDSIRYVDGQVTLSRSLTNVDLSLLAGGRGGSQNPGVDTRTQSWANLSAVAWVKPRLAIIASGGTYPVDPTQGFPGGRFLSVGVRLANPQKRVSTTVAPSSTGVAEAEAVALVPVVERFRVDRLSAESVSLRVSAPAAQNVEVAGDFSGWIPVKLQTTGDGWWTVALPLKPGRYQMNVRVDGSGWAVPPGLLSLQDEFGGSAGLLVID